MKRSLDHGSAQQTLLALLPLELLLEIFGHLDLASLQNAMRFLLAERAIRLDDTTCCSAEATRLLLALATLLREHSLLVYGACRDRRFKLIAEISTTYDLETVALAKITRLVTNVHYPLQFFVECTLCQCCRRMPQRQIYWRESVDPVFLCQLCHAGTYRNWITGVAELKSNDLNPYAFISPTLILKLSHSYPEIARAIYEPDSSVRRVSDLSYMNCMKLYEETPGYFVLDLMPHMTRLRAQK